MAISESVSSRLSNGQQLILLDSFAQWLTCDLKINSHLNQWIPDCLPEHVVPFPSYPCMQVHSKELSIFLQVAVGGQLSIPRSHSSISVA